MNINFRLPAYAPTDVVDTPEQKAAAEAAAATAAAEAAAKAGAGTTQTDAEKAAAAAAAAAASGKKDGEQTPEQKAAAEAAAKAAAGAPAKYALTLPDGGLILASDLKVLEDQARKANLTNEDAQAWLNEQALVAKARSDAFLAETTADPDLGGEHLPETQRQATAVINRIFPKGDAAREPFLAFLKSGGADNNIHVVRAFVRLAKLMGEDTKTGSTTATVTGEKDPAVVLYGGTAQT